jgi:hypothetical protein
LPEAGGGPPRLRASQLKARAAVIQHEEFQPADGRVEHITIDGEPEIDATPTEEPHRTTLQSHTLASPRHGCITELSILDGHYLGVRRLRPDSGLCKYQFDLRFANPTPIRVRRIPWVWLVLAIGLAAHGGGTLASAWPAGFLLLGPGVTGGVLTTTISIFALFVSFRRTTELLQIRSAHGDAVLVSVTGGIGSIRRYKKIFGELTRHIEAARLARPQEKQRYLCDEMREHYRLHGLGALSDKEYEASKKRILAAH